MSIESENSIRLNLVKIMKDDVDAKARKISFS